MMGSKVPRSIAATALAGIAIGALGGCGSSELTPNDFAQKVDTVCHDVITSAHKSAASRQTDAAANVRAAMATMVSRLETIDAPDSLDARFTQFKAALKGLAVGALKAGEAQRAHDSAQLAAAQAQLAQNQRTLTTLTRELNFRACA